MSRKGRFAKVLAWTMAVGLLVLIGGTTGSAFAHDVQHAAHHSPAMHGKGICAWMCAAGQALEEITLTVQSETAPVASLGLTPQLQPPSCHRPTSASRAPPAA
jgi:hypothetical protein